MSDAKSTGGNANTIWLIILIVAGLLLAVRGVMTGNGRAFVRAEQVEGSLTLDDGSEYAYDWTVYRNVDPRTGLDPAATDVSLSIPRTVGLWVGALFTLFILSFLYGDNPFYKLAEAVVVGTSAAYLMVTAFWSMIIPNLLAKLFPEGTKSWALPGLENTVKDGVDLGYTERELIYIVPLILGVMLLWRLAPKGGWISRWPLAFFIGATAGFRLIGYMEADFVAQLSATVMPFVEMTNGSFDFWASVANITIVIGVLSCLVYFFFSIEHTGAVGKVSRLGIWFLMITFGAGFGYTVMGRIALLSQRLEYLFIDWLWLIDPNNVLPVAGG